MCKPHLVFFGGNSGSEVHGDMWTVNVEAKPFVWT
jgi:hypothetical protein